MTSATILLAADSNAALFTFACYTAVVLALAVLSSRVQVGKDFLSEYFLGSRNLGMWAFALTFAATSASGGSFTGFPSLVYTHGWSLALWIGSYMFVPLIMMALLGKRLNQVARRAGAITIPDVMASRLDSRVVGIVATLLIVFFMTFNLVAQFKAGAIMLSTLLDEVPIYNTMVLSFGQWIDGKPLLGSISPGYLLCLCFFSIAVVTYTAYGGFRAVVWTDVLQGIVMVLGVILLFFLTLSQVGGLPQATHDLAQMVPPRFCKVSVQSDRPVDLGDWMTTPQNATGDQAPRVFRAGEFSDSGEVEAIEIISEHEVQRILDQLATQAASIPLVREVLETREYAYGDNETGVYLTCPGPHQSDAAGFLPLGIAISFFFYWTFSGAGQPSNMVRLMAFDSSATLRRATVTVAIYFSLIYFPLVIIFCCGRVLMPGMEVESDRIMPALAEHVTRNAGAPWLAGLLVAAPFAAVMSSVDSFLLMISSAIVRDIYQQEINPQASEKQIKRLTYLVTALVGVAAFLGTVNPPRFLQSIIVFTGGGLSGSFLIPMALALYWPRFNASGALAAMAAGFTTHVLSYSIGYAVYGEFRPLKIAGFDPFIPQLIASLVFGVIVCRATMPTSPAIVQRYFARPK